MSKTGCGGQPCTCGGCAGVRVLTPVVIENPPGQPALRYRVGTQARFFGSMAARLSSADFPALVRLTTRDRTDFSIALLDGWACVADVLSFYQERLANEGYLRTATERRSVLELARLVGYAPRPGVSATVYLAYTLDSGQRVTIPSGSRAQSVPRPGDLPQTYETGEDLQAAAELNAIRPRLSKPQYITPATLGAGPLFLAGLATALRSGDHLRLAFEGGQQALIRVREVRIQSDGGRTALTFDVIDNRGQATPVPPTPGALAAVIEKYRNYHSFGIPGSNPTAEAVLTTLTTPGLAPDLQTVRDRYAAASARGAGRLAAWLRGLLGELEAVSQEHQRQGSPISNGPTPPLTALVRGLLKPASLPPSSSRALSRDLTRLYARTSDQLPRLYGTLFPEIRDLTYAGYAGTRPTGTSPLQTVEALRVRASLFGHTIPSLQLNADGRPVFQARTIATSWEGLNEQQLALDVEDDRIRPGQRVAVRRPVIKVDPAGPAILAGRASEHIVGWTVVYAEVKAVETLSLSAYVVSSKVSVLTLAERWLVRAAGEPDLTESELLLRNTSVYAAGDKLTLAPEPVTDPLQDGAELELDGLYRGLASGRWAILSGERVDAAILAAQGKSAEGAELSSGVSGAELLMIASVEHRFARVPGSGRDLPGDTLHTFVRFARPLEYAYKRDTAVLHANVVKATHGETRTEVLGGGDATQAFQTFRLKQPPLTYTAAPTPAGAESTLEVRVNELAWHETPDFVGLPPSARAYGIRIDDDSQTSLIFGSGERGARLPSGLENVRATYRSGLGKGGNVEARQISTLMTRPLGVKEVVNPLPASGGADREGRDSARRNAPRAVLALDRLVSVQDYADFAASFAGIGKASAAELSDGARQLVHVTVAGADDIPIAPTSDLYRNLRQALRELGDPFEPLELAVRELRLLVVEAKVRPLPDFDWEGLEPRVRAAVLTAFGLGARDLAQGVTSGEVIAAIQAVPGVAYLDLDTLGALGAEELASGEPLAALGRADRVPARPARVNPARPRPPGEPALLPAQLLCLGPELPDTLILTEIK